MFLSEITAPSESRMTKGLQNLPNDAGGLDARVERCKMKHFAWVCARMCHKTGINQSFLIHKSFSLKYSCLPE